MQLQDHPLPRRGARRRACAIAAFASVAALAAPGAPAVWASSDGASAPAEAPRGARCKPSIEVSASQVLAGESVTVSGTLLCPEGVEAAGQAVTLLGEPRDGAPGFTAVATATSEPDGSYAITTPALDANTIFFVRAGRGHSARRRVSVAPQVSLVAPAPGSELVPSSRNGTLPATNTITFTGTVTPALPGELVVLQRERPAGSGRWRRVAVAHCDESSNYSITHTFKRPGTVTLRVVVRSRGMLALAASTPVTYTIAPRQVVHPARAHRARA